MTHWDGLASATSTGVPQRICILGATNRIQDIDDAILRRMPKKFPVSLPSAYQRRRIFKLVLRDTKLDAEDFDLDYLVRVSAGMSGSDIKEACRDAAMGPVREYIKEKKRLGTLGKAGVNPEEVRGVMTSDFFGSKASGFLTPVATVTPKGADGDGHGPLSLDASEASDEEEVFAESSKD